MRHERRSPPCGRAAGSGDVDHDCRCETQSLPLPPDQEQEQPLEAFLFCTAGARYSVTFADEKIVKSSRDPECDLARALIARGISGTVTVIDGKTGRPRSFI